LTSLVWIPEFVHPSLPVNSELDGPLYRILVDVSKGIPLLRASFALAFVILTGLLLYIIMTGHDLLPRESFVQVILLVIFLSWDSRMLAFQPVLPAAVFVLAGIQKLMGSYGKQEPYNEVFISAFLVGFASLFYIPAAYFIFMILFSFITYRITSWREWVIALTGFILPFIYLASWFYLNDEFMKQVNIYDWALFNPGLLLGSSVKDVVWYSATFLVLLVAIFRVTNVIRDKLISIRKKTLIMVNYMLSYSLIVLLSGATILATQQFIYIGMTFFMTLAVLLAKKAVWLDLFFLMYVILLVIQRFV
jgi:hypothetical protein